MPSGVCAQLDQAGRRRARQDDGQRRSAYGGSDVGYIGNGAGNTLTFTGSKAPRAGTYRVVVSYADDQRAGSGSYNANLVDRGFTVSTSSGTNETR